MVRLYETNVMNSCSSYEKIVNKIKIFYESRDVL